MTLMRCTIAGIGLILAVSLAKPAAAKLPVGSLRLAVGFGVEENASPEREILALWKRCLTAGLMLLDPDGNPVLIDQHVSKPQKK